MFRIYITEGYERRQGLEYSLDRVKDGYGESRDGTKEQRGQGEEGPAAWVLRPQCIQARETDVTSIHFPIRHV